MNRHRRNAGFSLIELMITLLIVAILTAIGSYVYGNYAIKNTRVGIQSFMQSIAGKQEQYMLDARAYASSVSTLSLTQPSWLSGKYTVAVTVQNSATPPSYTITATPAGGQVSDTDCGTMSLSSSGTKTASGTKGASGCW